ncbi:QcrA and Rieske domain-containing protein [Pontibacter fetidus]|uniref:Rieske 2Fe-2S domain-containing protein n=1 Tax=Pontibacter fetidus TaxID=2700082 RepID=A0A6B2H3H9_9BACT|nr:Rieske 2Fe-2S domain-containing protein [Pontibacter fetidus]NDK56971.1 Rieske 2Fe-2S domain-containing protein [Pontibacter fetidus]
MDRKHFIKTIGIGTGAFLFLACTGGCSSDSDTPAPNNPNNPPGNTKVDFTFDITTDSNLQNNGWTIRSGAIIAKSGNDFLAFQSTCTHQGNPLTYNAGDNTFPCSQQGPDHGSVFNASGVKITGPAIRSLKKYNTTLTGNNLRVFEA